MKIRDLWKRSISILSQYWVECGAVVLIMFGVNMVFFQLAVVVFADVLHFGVPNIASLIEQPDKLLGFLTSFIIGSVVLLPFTFGVKWCFLQAAKGHVLPVYCLFSCYTSVKRWGKVLLLSMWVIVRCLPVIVTAVALIIAGYIAYMSVIDLALNIFFSIIIVILMVLVVCTSAVLYSFLMAKYFMVPYVFVEYPDKPVREIIRESLELMKNNRRYMFVCILYTVPIKMISFGMTYISALVSPMFELTFSIAAEKIMAGASFNDHLGSWVFGSHHGGSGDKKIAAVKDISSAENSEKQLTALSEDTDVGQA